MINKISFQILPIIVVLNVCNWPVNTVAQNEENWGKILFEQLQSS
jgi:hypothetical protein